MVALPAAAPPVAAFCPPAAPPGVEGFCVPGVGGLPAPGLVFCRWCDEDEPLDEGARGPAEDECFDGVEDGDEGDEGRLDGEFAGGG